MNTELIIIVSTVLFTSFTSAVLIIGLFAWLRSDIRELGTRISNLSVDIAALKATVETFFRIRIDPQDCKERERD